MTDKTAPQGKKSLFFKTDTTTVVKEIVWVEVTPQTNYVFSTWIKGARISKDNPLYNATVGIVDESGTFLSMQEWVFLNGERQIVPTAWDNAWHLRAIQFNSADATRVGICLAGSGSQLWLDDMAMFQVGDGKKYMSDNMMGAIKVSFEESVATCQDKYNLIPDGAFNKKDADGFWADSHGWRNGVLSFVDNPYEYGPSMKYTASGRDSALSTIKWIDVEPHTDYTFSLNIRILKTGNGRLLLLDDKNRDKVEFLYVSFNRNDYAQEDARYGWYSLSCSFNTDEYSRIAVCVVDDGGEVLLDNMRLFKKANADKTVKDAFVPSPAAPNPEDNPDKGNDAILPGDPSRPTGTVSPDGTVDPENPDASVDSADPEDPNSPTHPDGSVSDDTSSEDTRPGSTDPGAKPKRVWIWLVPTLVAVLGAAAVGAWFFLRKKKGAAPDVADTPAPAEDSAPADTPAETE